MEIDIRTHLSQTIVYQDSSAHLICSSISNYLSMIGILAPLTRRSAYTAYQVFSLNDSICSPLAIRAMELDKKKSAFVKFPFTTNVPYIFIISRVEIIYQNQKWPYNIYAILFSKRMTCNLLGVTKLWFADLFKFIINRKWFNQFM